MVAKVDRNAIKFNQVGIAVVSIASFLGDLPHLAGLLAVVLAVATARPTWGLFRTLYQRVVLPLRWLRPHVLDDDPAPHRFAQGVGAAFLGLGWIALISGASVVGWALVLLVAVLALVNVVFDFCAGCFVYYQLRRFGLIGRTAAQE
ncbi:MAG TPA: DUF4395 domain-containing protein [Anaerolineales bacterium]|nr:DUF4395 domain-containing protein [Anaerolineales bacterium]